MHFKVRQSDRVSDSRFYRLEIIRIADFCGAVNCNKIAQNRNEYFRSYSYINMSAFTGCLKFGNFSLDKSKSTF